MARQVKQKKSRAHVAAAHSKGGANRAKSSSSTSATAQLGAAAVAATFGADDAADDDARPMDNEQSGDEDGGDGDASALSRGQRKRQKRRAAFLKKMGLVQRVTKEAAAASKRAEQGAFADLEALQASLFAPDAAAAPGKQPPAATDALQKKKMSGKQRQRLAVRELLHLKAVHAHASFQGNAFAAIQTHLQNTVVQANAANMKKTAAAAKGGSMDTD